MILWLFTRIPCEIAPWCTEQLSGERHLNGYRIGRRIANTVCGASWAKGYRANHRCTVRSRRFVEKSAAAFPSLVVSLVGLPVWLDVLISVGVIGVLVLLVRSGFASMRWITFDRRAKQLVFERRVGFRNQRRIECTYPLATLRAVQLLHSGRHSVSEPQGAGDRQIMSYREFDGYELNLVLDDSALPRLNLASLTDWQWIRETGGRIAEFLGVPLIDKLYHGG
jgi:hypothetical protein